MDTPFNYWRTPSIIVFTMLTEMANKMIYEKGKRQISYSKNTPIDSSLAVARTQDATMNHHCGAACVM